MLASRYGVAGDSVAIGMSSLCLAHCLALPLAASLFPIVGAWADAKWVHWLFVLIAAPISLWTLGLSPNRSTPILGLAGAGLALLFGGAAGFPSHALEMPTTVAGGVLVAGAHILNWRRRRACGQREPAWG